VLLCLVLACLAASAVAAGPSKPRGPIRFFESLMPKQPAPAFIQAPTPPTEAEWRYALAFALFRNAGIRQGVYKRALDGNASSDAALVHGKRAAAVAGLGWRIASGEGDAKLLKAD
jgi:hypothetical protein